MELALYSSWNGMLGSLRTYVGLPMLLAILPGANRYTSLSCTASPGLLTCKAESDVRENFLEWKGDKM